MASLSESVWVHQWQKAISLSQHSCIISCQFLWANTGVWRIHCYLWEIWQFACLEKTVPFLTSCYSCIHSLFTMNDYSFIIHYEWFIAGAFFTLWVHACVSVSIAWNKENLKGSMKAKEHESRGSKQYSVAKQEFKWAQFIIAYTQIYTLEQGCIEAGCVRSINSTASSRCYF